MRTSEASADAFSSFQVTLMFGLLSAAIAAGFPGSLPAMLLFNTEPLAHLRALDMVVIASTSPWCSGSAST